MSEAAQAPQPRAYRYYDLVMVAFVVILLCSNLIGASKAAQITLPEIGPITFSLPVIGPLTFDLALGPITFGAGVLFFPISYVFGDVLTEVYGYARARKVIWAGFAALIFAALMAAVIVALPPAPDWPNQAAFEIAFGNTWRIALSSMTAYFCGEFVNSFVLAKMKVWTNGKFMGLRFVGSTIAGEAVDSAIFYPAAFLGSGMMPDELVWKLMVAQFFTKTLVEIVFLPITYWVVNKLKKAEHEDFYDRGTDFNPLKLG